MNVVVCVGYFDKHTRFFHKINQSVNSKHNAKFIIHSINLSGWLRKLFYYKRGYWISAQTWWISQTKKNTYNSIIKNQEVYKDIDFKSLITYHIKNAPKTNLESLQIQSLAYIDIYEAEIKKFNPSFFLLLGDSRLAVECCVAVAKKHNIPFYFLEQGPVNTTIFNSHGVNANWPLTPPSKIKSNKTGFNLPGRKTTYIRNPFYRAIDILAHFLLNEMYIYPPDLHQKKNPVCPKTIKSSARSKNQNQKENLIFLLALQDDSDVNMIYHSPYFKNTLELLKGVYNNLPINTQLIVREHPKQKGRYNEDVYHFINENPIILDNKTPLNQLIDNVNVVVVNNSTVGIEALLKHKVLVVLGNAYYAFDEICLRLKNEHDLKDLLLESQTKRVNVGLIDCFLDELFNKNLIEGDIASKEVIAAQKIANIISGGLS